MSILVECLACSGQFRVDKLHAGKRIRCPGCQGVISVPAVPVRQDFSRPAPPVSQTQSTPAPRPVEDASSKPRRRRSGTIDNPSVHAPQGADRYTQARTGPWKIVILSAGAVVALGFVSIILFSFIRGAGSRTELAGTVPPSHSQATSVSDGPDIAQTDSYAAEDSSVQSAPGLPTIGTSTFANGIAPIASGVRNPPAGGKPGIR